MKLCSTRILVLEKLHKLMNLIFSYLRVLCINKIETLKHRGSHDEYNSCYQNNHRLDRIFGGNYSLSDRNYKSIDSYASNEIAGKHVRLSSLQNLSIIRARHCLSKIEC